jgi:DNA repair exonuclease SbcCD ATPase subunit
MLKATQQLKERKRELLGLDTVTENATESMSASERAAKKLAESLSFWEQRTKDLQSAEYKRLVTLRESARQTEAYEKSLVDALTPAQKMAKAENELRKELERGRIQLKLFDKGLAQANIEQQESISIKRQLAQSQARLNNAYSKEYEQLVRNNAMIRKRKRELEELHGFHQRMSKTNFSSGATMAGSLFGAASGTFVAAELIRVADAYTNIQNRLAVVTDGTMNLADATRGLLDVSIRSRTSLDTTMDVYAKMIRVTKDMTFGSVTYY